jgi:hypothetical protein
MQHPAVTIVWAYVHLAWERARATVKDDQGGVTLETVGWYIAAGLGVVVVAGIIWASIKSKASQPLPTPQAP